jgi:hypothetical protein
VVEEAIRIIEVEGAQTQLLAERGLGPWVSFGAHSNVEGFAAEATWIRENRALLLG